MRFRVKLYKMKSARQVSVETGGIDAVFHQQSVSNADKARTETLIDYLDVSINIS